MSLLLDDVYFNGLIQGRYLSTRTPVRLATTANITLSGTQTIDGVLAAVGNRILVKNQTTTSQNGIYVVASGSWLRADDFAAGDVATTFQIYVLEGTTNGKIDFICNTSPAVVGVNGLSFRELVNTTSSQSIDHLYRDSNTIFFINSSDQTKRIMFDSSLNVNDRYNFPDASGELMVANTSQTISNKTMTDNITFISDDGNSTKKAAFQLSGITTGNTRILTAPDASGALVTLNGTQTLTNKTLTFPSMYDIRDITYNSTILATANSGLGDDLWLTLSNGDASGPSISGDGFADASIDLWAKGSESIQFKSTSSNAATRYYNSLGNYFELKAPSSMSENVTMQLPTTLPTSSKQMLKVQGSTGQLEFSLDRLTFTLSNTTNIAQVTPKILATTCFTWIQSYYGVGGTLEIEDAYCTYMYKATAEAFGRVLTVEIMDAFSEIVLGTSTVTLNTVTETAVRFQFNLPTANASLQMRISANGSGGSINIYGGTLDLGKK